ncbi:MAG: tRNA preQ1(34) S-adenosylmethionine ribosyltransferase-isomerase QueA [Bacteroidetes bacterium]|nr:tRNA preQ1(34) S-adenosylmethionine ribosyltransferase-isomerase QueA [Bacteroidota bacterium]
MKLSDFKFKLPEKYIAQYPVSPRDKCKLMVLDRKTGEMEDKKFRDVVEHITKKDCLVVNETRVFPARLMARKEKTNAKVEVFLLRELESNLWEVLVKPARKVRIGNRLVVDGVYCDVIDNTVSGGRVVRFNYTSDFHKFIDKIGQCPLPPYIKRPAEESDKEDYQTVFARVRGSVAAPTAGLHFTKEIMSKLKRKGVKIAPLVLHVGLGTFRKVQVEDLGRHKMDSEYYEIPEETARAINKTKDEGGKVIAVGSTAIRSIESAVTSLNRVKPHRGWTDKFIYPPYEFKIVDKLITNFHTPESTLLMLACAFGGRENILKAYKKAMKDNYRFYSFGDAMLIE